MELKKNYKIILNNKIEIIDYLKGFSISTIVLMHLIQNYSLPQPILKASAFGGAGVHVFILCSGFGLYLSYLKKPLTYIQFLKKRFFKIYIPYILIVLLCAFTPFYHTTNNKLLELCSHIFLFKMFFESLEGTFGFQMWFISTIIQFYLLWPFIIHFFQKINGWKVVTTSICISLSWSVLIIMLDTYNQRIWNSFFLQFFWEFILGMKLAEQYYYKQDAIIKIPSLPFLICSAGIGIILTAILGNLGGWFKILNDIPSLIGYASIILITYKIFPIIWRKFILFTNKILYEWYLTHILVFSFCTTLLPNYNIIESMITNLCLSYFVSYLYFRLLKIIHIK